MYNWYYYVLLAKLEGVCIVDRELQTKLNIWITTFQKDNSKPPKNKGLCHETIRNDRNSNRSTDDGDMA